MLNISSTMKRKAGTPVDERKSKNRQGELRQAEPLKWTTIPTFSPKIDSIDNLLDLAWNKGGGKFANWLTLWSLIPVLTDLRNMAGMEDVKEYMINFVLYNIQGFGQREGESYHTMIIGPSGSGKTNLAMIMARLYHNLGFARAPNIIPVAKTDLTEDKLKELLPSARRGVLLIDGIGSVSLNHAKLLNAFLEDYKRDTICIFTSSEEDVESSNLTTTKFPWHFSTTNCTPTQMFDIFSKRAKREQWMVADKAISSNTFSRHSDIFLGNGNDIVNFFVLCKTNYARRVAGEAGPDRMFIKKDIVNALAQYKKMKKGGRDHDSPSYIS